jgi:hypothetical protein
MPNYVITNKLVKVCKAEGMLPAALEDWPEAHEKDFVLNSAGKVRSRIGDMKVKDYVRAVKERTPTFFSGPTENTKGKNNPWSAEGWNVTRQGQLVKANPEGAAQIAAKAGS